MTPEPAHNKQIKKEALRAPIIKGVVCFVASASRRKQPVTTRIMREIE